MKSKLLLCLLFASQVQAEEAGVIPLFWVPPTSNVDGTPLTDLVGYTIFYGQNIGDYNTEYVLDDPTLTDFKLPVSADLLSTRVYIAMKARNEKGESSAYSNEIFRVVEFSKAPPSEGVIINVTRLQ